MNLTLIYGSKRSKKTTFCLEKIEELKNSDNSLKFIILVPEQYSYSREKLICDRFGGTGLNGIEVMTFSKLARTLITTKQKNHITPCGKQMLIQNIIKKAKDEKNPFFSSMSKPGFSKSMLEVITELKRHMITPNYLLEITKNIKEGNLSDKLFAISTVYKQYSEEIDENFYDNENDLKKLSDAIYENGEIFKNTYIFIDEFSDFLPCHYNVIEALLRKCLHMFVTIPCQKNDVTDFSNIVQDTKNRIKSIANKNEINIFEIECPKNPDAFSSEELSFLFDNYSKSNFQKVTPYDKECEDIELFFAKDPYSEIENIAKKINELIYDKNLRYRDISLVYGDEDKYSHIIEAVFSDYNIPYFSDKKLVITDHPIIKTVLGAFDIFEENWSYDSVFKYLKNGYIYTKDDDGVINPINRDDVDLLESFVLKRGIRGKKKWLESDNWKYSKKSISEVIETNKNESFDDDKTIRINNIRKIITKPLDEFLQKISRKNNPKIFAHALFEFLEDINLYDGLTHQTEEMCKLGLINEAEQLKQVWDLLLEAIDQSVTVLNDEKCTRMDFSEYLCAGLSKCEISIIPSSIDSVTVASSDSAFEKNAKALFVAGAIRGELPKEQTKTGLLSDSDRTKVSELIKPDGIEFLSDSKKQRLQSAYKLFKILQTTTKYLFVSYPANTFEGEALLPSELIINLLKLFPKIKQLDDISYKNNEILKLSPKAAFSYILKNRNNKYDAYLPTLYSKLSKNPEWNERLKAIRLCDYYKASELKITPKNAQMLYENKTSYSITGLGEYSNCPFKYFITNGLKIKPSEVWQIQKFDLGSIMHYIMRRYCEIIQNNAKTFYELKSNWDKLTKEKSEKIIDDIVNELTPKILSSLDKDELKVSYLLKRISKTVKRTAETVRISIINGSYAVSDVEKTFLVNICDEDSPIMMRGTIDRIDVATFDEEKQGAIRIIDYKSGKKDFSVVSVCNMQDIQLLVYAACASILYKEGHIKYLENTSTANICGIMYNMLRDDLKEEKLSALTDKENISVSKSILKGPVILEENEDNSNDFECSYENAYQMDEHLKTEGSSSFLNLKFKNNGELHKSSDVFLRSDFEKLIKYIKIGIKKADNEIKSGNIAIKPYATSNNSSCDFCDMYEICLFDKEKDKTRKLCKNTDEAWEIINNTIENGN